MTTGWDLGSDSPLLAAGEQARGRARFSIEQPAPSPRPHQDGLLAGAAEVDITPPPGLPKAGYSRNAHTGTGFRTRLRARVLHLRSGASSLALVQCDLLGGSAVLQRLVARAVARRTDLPLAGLMIGATHTHGGPGQFLGTGFYNRFASNRPGFDAAWAQLLSERIAAGVEEAVATRRPARLAVGTTEVWGLTRNRSLEPHVRNRDLDDRRSEPQRAYVDVNPELHVIRVDGAARDGGHEPMAAAVVFSVHGTGVPMRSPTYNADLWAYLTDEMAARIGRATGCRPVVGAMEGTHADVAPAVHPGQAGHLEAERIGRAVGGHAADLHERLEGELSDRVELACGLREVDLDRDRTIGEHTLPRRPAVGTALVAGAFENETPVVGRIPPFRAGSPRRRPAGAQGVKRVLGGPLQRLAMPLRSFPRVLPLQVLRVGPAVLVGLPFELTVGTGRRIAASVAGRVRTAGVDRVVVSSVANEYSGYCTTPEEYGAQHYEGGHTLYGPGTQPFLGAHAATLAGDTVRDRLIDDTAPRRSFDLDHRRYLPPESADGPSDRAVAGPARFVDATADADPFWEQVWGDGAPGDLAWHRTMVAVEAADGHGDWFPLTTDGGRPLDDGACDLEVVHLGPAGGPRDGTRPGAGGHRYAVRWHRPAFRRDRRYRFVLRSGGSGPELRSAPFS